MLAVCSDKEKVQKFFRRIDRIFDVMAGLTTALIFVFLLIQISGRVLDSPAPWTEEGTRFVFIWMIYLGIGIGFRKGESARVTIFLRWMPRVVQQASKWVYLLTSAGFFLFMLVTGVELAMQQVNMNELGSALMIPMWLIGICVPVSAALGLLGLVESVLLHPEVLEAGE